MSTLADILERRSRLLERADAQRRDLAAAIDGCRSTLTLADRGVRVIQWLRKRRYLVAIAAAALAASRPRRVLRMGTRALMLWRLGRSLLNAFQALSANRPARAADHPEVTS